MAVPVAHITLIIRIEAVEKTYAGGLAAFMKDNPFCPEGADIHDKDLYVVAYAESPNQIQFAMDWLTDQGFTSQKDFIAVQTRWKFDAGKTIEWLRVNDDCTEARYMGLKSGVHYYVHDKPTLAGTIGGFVEFLVTAALIFGGLVMIKFL